eukprot:11805615-Ditylum_brightwellii.AAC.1
MFLYLDLSAAVITSAARNLCVASVYLLEGSAYQPRMRANIASILVYYQLEIFKPFKKYCVTHVPCLEEEKQLLKSINQCKFS